MSYIINQQILDGNAIKDNYCAENIKNMATKNVSLQIYMLNIIICFIYQNKLGGLQCCCAPFSLTYT